MLAGPLYCPVGYLPGRRRTAGEWERSIDGYQQIAPVLEEHSIDLCIEPLNRFEAFFLNTTADTPALCQEVNQRRVGILWDTFHANIEKKNLGEALRLCGPHLKHVHACENDRGIPAPAMSTGSVFSAHFPNSGIRAGSRLRALASLPVICRPRLPSWRDLADNAEQIPWLGVDFLKRKKQSHERKRRH